MKEKMKSITIVLPERLASAVLDFVEQKKQEQKAFKYAIWEDLMREIITKKKEEK